jgi:hypothetical protein
VTEYLPWIFAAVVLLGTAGALWFSLRRPGEAPGGEELYQLALEAWIEGEKDQAALLLRQVVQENPDQAEAFLHLGTLLREQGDPARAAVPAPLPHGSPGPQPGAQGLDRSCPGRGSAGP